MWEHPWVAGATVRRVEVWTGGGLFGSGNGKVKAGCRLE
jgi:hypothetical protein